MSVAIKIENLSKQYRLGLVSTRTLSHDLNRWWQTSILGKDDPYLKIGQENKLTTHNSSLTTHHSPDYVWALKDINLEAQEGEVLGIIGKNGAGKSTLLKILSRVTAPTIGTIKARGRIASLLEIGTGFHQEMTGRENIFLNGAILGMTKTEIRSKFDEIVDFAGVERYINTPVKRYSSGMIVRLGFAVAAFLEPEILVVDEVLAVGDAEFQNKAIGKMQDVSKNEGRTVLFVSHNMAAVKNLCNKGIVLKNGRIDYRGKIDECINFYLSQNIVSNSDFIQNVSEVKRNRGSQNAIKKVWIENKNNLPTNVFLMGEKMNFCFEFELLHVAHNINIGFGIEDVYGNRIFSLNNEISEGEFFRNVQSGIAIFKVKENILLPGNYYLTVSMVSGGNEWIDFLPQAINFFVEATDVYGSGKLVDSSQGIIFMRGDIKIESQSNITN